MYIYLHGNTNDTKVGQLIHFRTYDMMSQN